MPEQKREIVEKIVTKQFRVDYVCDECDQGKMVSNGSVIFSFPLQYEHVCNKCGNVRHFLVKYPAIRREVIDGLD
jgi:hypothetical protein